MEYDNYILEQSLEGRVRVKDSQQFKDVYGFQLFNKDNQNIFESNLYNQLIGSINISKLLLLFLLHAVLMDLLLNTIEIKNIFDSNDIIPILVLF